MGAQQKGLALTQWASSPVRAILRPTREALGLTQMQAAQRVGMHHTDMSKVERGIYLPTVTNMRKMQALYGLDDAWLEAAFGFRACYDAEVTETTRAAVVANLKQYQYKTKLCQPTNLRQPTNDGDRRSFYAQPLTPSAVVTDDQPLISPAPEVLDRLEEMQTLHALVEDELRDTTVRDQESLMKLFHAIFGFYVKHLPVSSIRSAFETALRKYK